MGCRLLALLAATLLVVQEVTNSADLTALH